MAEHTPCAWVGGRVRSVGSAPGPCAVPPAHFSVHPCACPRGRLTPCTTSPWLTVKGKSTACTISQGTPEASSCEIQKAGLAGLPQLTTDMEVLKRGEDWTCGRTRGLGKAPGPSVGVWRLQRAQALKCTQHGSSACVGVPGSGAADHKRAGVAGRRGLGPPGWPSAGRGWVLAEGASPLGS